MTHGTSEVVRPSTQHVRRGERGRASEFEVSRTGGNPGQLRRTLFGDDQKCVHAERNAQHD